MSIQTDLNRPIAIQDVALSRLDGIQHAISRASTFTSVSGWNTAFLGCLALIVSAISWDFKSEKWLVYWVCLGACSFVIGLLGIYLRAKKTHQPMLGASGKRFFLGLVPSLAAGLLLSVAEYQRGLMDLLPGVWLLSFGLGVLSGGLANSRLYVAMGFSFIAVSPFALLGPVEWGRPLLAFGFGALNVLFGVLIARRTSG